MLCKELSALSQFDHMYPGIKLGSHVYDLLESYRLGSISAYRRFYIRFVNILFNSSKVINHVLIVGVVDVHLSLSIYNGQTERAKFRECSPDCGYGQSVDNVLHFAFCYTLFCCVPFQISFEDTPNV